MWCALVGWHCDRPTVSKSPSMLRLYQSRTLSVHPSMRQQKHDSFGISCRWHRQCWCSGRARSCITPSLALGANPSTTPPGLEPCGAVRPRGAQQGQVGPSSGRECARPHGLWGYGRPASPHSAQAQRPCVPSRWDTASLFFAFWPGLDSPIIACIQDIVADQVSELHVNLAWLTLP